MPPRELQAGSRTRHRRAPRGAPRKPEDDVRKRRPKEVPSPKRKPQRAYEEPKSGVLNSPIPCEGNSSTEAVTHKWFELEVRKYQSRGWNRDLRPQRKVGST